jgi:hypothetical protein
VFEQAYVVQWLAWHGNHVREIASLNAADPVVPAEQFSRMQGGGPDRLQRALTAADVIGELPRVESVRVDAAISAERNAHARLHALGESRSLRLGRLVVLSEHVGAPALLPADLGDVVTAVDVRYQKRPGGGHHLNCFVVHERTMLDRAHAAAHGALDAFRAVRVRGDVGAVHRRLLHSHPDLLLSELRGAGHASWRHHGAGSYQLDQVRAALQHAPHRTADVID